MGEFDAERRHRHRCTAWLSIRGVVYQCDSGFCDENGRHRGPHFRNERSDTGPNIRMTWQNAREVPPETPPFEAGQ